MSTPQIDARALAQSGIEALRKGDARRARESFERIVAAGQADTSVYLGLAIACQVRKDHDAAAAAVDKALALEPRNLEALLFKADQLTELGDERGALAFYRAAVEAAPPAPQLPEELREGIGRAQTECARYATKFATFLQDRLLGNTLAEGRPASRFRQSLDILAGKKKIFFQEPRHYFFPELPQIQFFDRNDFPWLDRVEAATGEIRAELIEVLKDPSAFRPYVEAQPGRPHKEQAGMLDNPDWSAFYLWKHGRIVPENAARCPRTVSVMAEAPLTKVRNRSPSVLFSLLRPGARIPPHTGEVNSRLICHLPLIVPRDCRFRVGNDTRTWVEGRAWVFDDTIEHEAWNGSGETRVVLLFEIWRPELTAEERGLVTAMYEAIDEYGGHMPEWET